MLQFFNLKVNKQFMHVFPLLFVSGFMSKIMMPLYTQARSSTGYTQVKLKRAQMLLAPFKLSQFAKLKFDQLKNCLLEVNVFFAVI